MAQGKEDNVHVVSCFDQYVFKKSADGNTIVVNTSDYTYGVTKYAALVQPNVFYGDFIHLDKAQSKGVAQYKAAIPKNVFSMIARCVFQLSHSESRQDAEGFFCANLS